MLSSMIQDGKLIIWYLLFIMLGNSAQHTLQWYPSTLSMQDHWIDNSTKERQKISLTKARVSRIHATTPNSRSQLKRILTRKFEDYSDADMSDAQRCFELNKPS